MKVMVHVPAASCLSCGSVMMNLGYPDRQTGDFAAACGNRFCDRNGIAVRLSAPIIEAPLVYPEWR